MIFWRGIGCGGMCVTAGGDYAKERSTGTGMFECGDGDKK